MRVTFEKAGNPEETVSEGTNELDDLINGLRGCTTTANDSVARAKKAEKENRKLRNLIEKAVGKGDIEGLVLDYGKLTPVRL